MENVSLAAQQKLVPFLFLTDPRVYLGVTLAWLGESVAFAGGVQR